MRTSRNQEKLPDGFKGRGGRHGHRRLYIPYSLMLKQKTIRSIILIRGLKIIKNYAEARN